MDSRGSVGPDAARVQRRLGIAALFVLILSASALAYTMMNAREAGDVLIVNGVEYRWDGLEANFTVREMDGHAGILLSDLINDTGLADPGDHEYRLIGADGYQKTVGWSDMQAGLLEPAEKRVYFRDLPKQYRVRDLVEIEVM